MRHQRSQRSVPSGCTYQQLEPRQLLACTPVGELNSGVAVSDDATGEGVILYSVEDVHTRFGGMPLENADHFFAARLRGGQWQYNNDTEWVNFDRLPSDARIADVYFDSDRTGGMGVPTTGDHDVWVRANYFGGLPDVGEFQLIGSCINLNTDRYEPGTTEYNLTELATGFNFYESVHGEFPNLAIYDQDGRALLSWRVQLLPFLGYGDLFQRFDLNEAWDSEHNLALLDQMPDIFAGPGQGATTKTVYQAFAGENTVMPLVSGNYGFRHVTDGAQNTLLFVETDPEYAVEWTKPVDLLVDQYTNPFQGLGRSSREGIGAVTLDREFMRIPMTVSAETFRDLIDRNDGNFVDVLEFAEPLEEKESLQNLTLAIHDYESAFKRFPNQAIYDSDNLNPLLSWRVAILPMLGYQNLYDQFRLDEPWDSEHNLSLLPQMPREFGHESTGDGFTRYLAVSGPGTLFEVDPDFEITFSNIFDGPQNTIMLVQSDISVEWTRPLDHPFDVVHPKANLGAGIGEFHGSFADGSAVTIPLAETDDNVANMMRRADSQFVDHSMHDPYNSIDFNLRAIALAALNYESAHMHLPTQAITADDGTPLLSWRVTLLPFLGFGEIYKQLRLDEPWDSEHNLGFLEKMPRVFAAPGLAPGMTKLMASVGDETVFTPDQREFSLSQIIDGTSRTLLFMEADESRAVEWTRPVDLAFDANVPRSGLGSDYGGGFHAIFADGQYEFIDPFVADSTVAAMFQRADRQTFVNDFRSIEGKFERVRAEQNRLQQLALAAHNYESAYAEFPAHAIYNNGDTPLLSWRVRLLPFIEQHDLYRKFNLDEPWDSETNLALINQMPDLFSSPGLANGWTQVQAVTTEAGSVRSIFPRADIGTTFDRIFDGTSNTGLFFSSNPENAVIWTKPDDIEFDSGNLKSSLGQAQVTGFNVAMADGSIQFVDSCVSEVLLSNVVLIADGNPYDPAFELGCNDGQIQPYQLFRNSPGNVTRVPEMGLGVAVQDDAIGTGFLMYSEQDVFSRFEQFPPLVGNARHVVAVQHDGVNWHYNDNRRWIPFVPRANDRLIAAINFELDSIHSLEGQVAVVNGISHGFDRSDLWFVADRWDGKGNSGEFEIGGSHFEGDALVAIGDTRMGVAIDDNYNGNGYIMYSPDRVHDRFQGIIADNANHFVAVRNVDGNWHYNNNAIWQPFIPIHGDRLVAYFDFSRDSFFPLTGLVNNFDGIDTRYESGDLSFVVDQFGGAHNFREIEVLGSYFTAKTYVPIDQGLGVAVQDDATGTGFLMYSEANVHRRFADAAPNVYNSPNFIAVRFESGNWEYNNNKAWFPFEPMAGDRLLASVDFSRHSIQDFRNQDWIIEGIPAGFLGNYEFDADQFAYQDNYGEYQVTAIFMVVDYQPQTVNHDRFSLGSLNSGIGVEDDATGLGYLMYSDQSVHQRFSGQPNAQNSDHLIAVRFLNGIWQFNSNRAWIDFVPRMSDQLLAKVDFDQDTVVSLVGQFGVQDGIGLGYREGDLTFYANRWGGNVNSGEFEVSGTYFTTEKAVVVGQLNKGVAVDDQATGVGYLMYSPETVQSRFGVSNENSSNFVAVRYEADSWQFNDDSVWIDFVPEFGDRLVATVDFENDTVNSFQGQIGVISGVAYGFRRGNLRFTSNVWDGGSDIGEFEVKGTFFTAFDTEATGPQTDGIAVADDATGTGYLMYSRTNVFDRFMTDPPHAANNRHVVAVRFNGLNWEFNNNARWVSIELAEGDRLLAAIDFDNDQIETLEGRDEVFEGLDLGFEESDLSFIANSWAGEKNSGEFEIIGSYFAL